MKKEYRKPEVTVIELGENLMGDGDGNLGISGSTNKGHGAVPADAKDHNPGLFSNDEEKPLWDDTDK